MSRLESASILQSLGFVPDVDFVCTQSVPGSVTIQWFSAVPQPTDAELDAIAWSPAVEAAWQAQESAAVIGRESVCWVTADQLITSGTLVDVTDLVFPVKAGVKYALTFDGVYTADAATTGLQIALNGPAATFFGAALEIATSTTAWLSRCVSAFDTPVLGGGSAGATPLPFHITGVLLPSANGLVRVRAQREPSASGGTPSITIKKGSFGKLSPVS